MARKKVATFVTTSFRERKTGLKPANYYAVNQQLTNYTLVFLVLPSVRWLNNSFALNFEIAYLPLNWCCVFHRQSHFKFILPIYRNGVIKY